MTERRSVHFQASRQTSIPLDTIVECEEKEDFVSPEVKTGTCDWLAQAIQDGNDKAIETWLDEGITEVGGQKSLRQSRYSTDDFIHTKVKVDFQRLLPASMYPDDESKKSKSPSVGKLATRDVKIS